MDKSDSVMAHSKAVAFDVDPASLISIRQAFPKWDIEDVEGRTATSFARDWNGRVADLLVVGARADEAEILELCRGLRKQVGWALTPLLVLVPAEHQALVREVLKAGANHCLVLPIHAKEVASMLVHALAGNHPGRHTMDLERAQIEDRWRDDGGQG